MRGKSVCLPLHGSKLAVASHVLCGCFCILLTMTQPLRADNAALEQRVAELEHAVQQMQRLLDEKFADDRWKEPILWSRIRPGMTESDVRKLLGKPTRIEQAIFTTWYYHETSRDHSHVWFDEGKVLGFEGLDRN